MEGRKVGKREGRREGERERGRKEDDRTLRFVLSLFSE